MQKTLHSDKVATLEKANEDSMIKLLVEYQPINLSFENEVTATFFASNSWL